MSTTSPRLFNVTTTVETLSPVHPAGDVIYVSTTGPGFTNLVEAVAAASAGSLVIVTPGDYTVTGDDQLLKDEVDIHFSTGVTLNKTIPATGNGWGLFDDRALASGVNCRITGAADIVLTFSGNASNDGAGVYTGKASTILYFECNSISVNDPTGTLNTAAFKTRNCTRVFCRIRDIFSRDKANDETQGIYWNDGEAYYHVERIVTGGTAVHFETADTTGTEGFFFGNYVESNATFYPQAIVCSGGAVSNGNYRGWIIVNEAASKKGSAIVCAGNASKFYVNCQKAGTMAASDGSGVVELGGGANAWIQVEKITGFNNPGIRLNTGYTGTVKIRFQEIEDISAMPVGIHIIAGTLYADGKILKVLNGKGVLHAGGTSFVNGLRIDTSSTNGATNRPVEISAAGLTINGCSLIAPAAADSVYAGSALVLKNIGSVANRAAHVNVTINDGTVQPLGVWSGFA